MFMKNASCIFVLGTMFTKKCLKGRVVSLLSNGMLSEANGFSHKGICVVIGLIVLWDGSVFERANLTCFMMSLSLCFRI